MQEVTQKPREKNLVGLDVIYFEYTKWTYYEYTIYKTICLDLIYMRMLIPLKLSTGLSKAVISFNHMIHWNQHCTVNGVTL